MTEAIRQGDIPGVQLRHRRPLALTVDTAWSWLTEPDRLARWAADRAEVRIGSQVALVLERATEEAAPLREEGETLEIEAPTLWSLAFRQRGRGWQSSTRLTLRLAERPEGCELDIFHEGFEHLCLSTCLTVWEEYRRRWRDAAALLARESAAAAG